ncbi:hypothetical protein FA13DRAFT_1697810 [Coprinellus micaceus]|uniref:Uncharacterized protein n=1 Tax=Coprinellus micaceus TaxID=71717 RepID=A0A4Y7SCH7_COPMI|nr:hypothetical protein FA13DRAFT_1697810 [Coprinellus micaceus]
MARVPNRERGAISTPLVLSRFLKHPRQPHFPNLCPRTLMPPKNIKGLAAARSIVSIPGTEPDASPTAAPLPAGAPKAQRAPPRRDMARPSAKKKGKTPITNSVAPAPATTPSATVANVPSHLPESSSSPGIRTLQHDITAVKARIEELQLHEIAPLNHRLTELENVDLTLLNERMDGVEGSETDLDVRMKAMKASMDRSKVSNKDFTVDITSINSKIHGLQDLISSAKDTANLARATADEAIGMAEEARGDSEGLSARLDARDTAGAEIENLKIRVDALSSSLDTLRRLPSTRNQLPPPPQPSRTMGEPAQPLPTMMPAHSPRTSPNNMPRRNQPGRASNRAAPYHRHPNAGPSGRPNPSPTTGFTIVAYGPHPDVPSDNRGNPITFFHQLVSEYNDGALRNGCLRSAVRIQLTDNYTLCFQTLDQAQAFVDCVWAQPPISGASAYIPDTIPNHVSPDPPLDTDSPAPSLDSGFEMDIDRATSYGPLH